MSDSKVCLELEYLVKKGNILVTSTNLKQKG